MEGGGRRTVRRFNGAAPALPRNCQSERPGECGIILYEVSEEKPVQLPNPEPKRRVETMHGRIGINLMGKRYAIETSTRTYQVRTEDAEESGGLGDAARWGRLAEFLHHPIAPGAILDYGLEHFEVIPIVSGGLQAPKK
jgi:hypothetical protein